MTKKYIALLMAFIAYTAFVGKFFTEHTTNKIKAQQLEYEQESAEKAQVATVELNSELEVLDEEASRIITQKPHNATECISPDVLRMLDGLTNKITD